MNTTPNLWCREAGGEWSYPGLSESGGRLYYGVRPLENPFPSQRYGLFSVQVNHYLVVFIVFT